MQFHLGEGLRPAVGLHAPVVADTALPVVETFVDGNYFAALVTLVSLLLNWVSDRFKRSASRHASLFYSITKVIFLGVTPVAVWIDSLATKNASVVGPDDDVGCSEGIKKKV